MKKCLLLLLMALILTSFQQEHVTTIFVIGDSTAAKKDLSTGSPERGWAMALQCYFDSTFVRVDNHAVNGRSSKSFINEKRWDKVVSLIKPGDYVIIQFGHNDEKPKADRHTDPGSTFDYNLAKFIRETREKGGIPIVMNAVVRRNWQPAGEAQATSTIGTRIDDEKLRDTISKQEKSKAKKSGKAKANAQPHVLVDTHGLYIVAPRDVAQRMNAYFIDANRITHDLETSMGEEGSKRLHMIYKPGECLAIPQGREDNTHYNIYGAHQVAKLLADALCEEIPLLTRYRTTGDACQFEK